MLPIAPCCYALPGIGLTTVRQAGTANSRTAYSQKAVYHFHAACRQATRHEQEIEKREERERERARSCLLACMTCMHWAAAGNILPTIMLAEQASCKKCGCEGCFLYPGSMHVRAGWWLVVLECVCVVADKQASANCVCECDRCCQSFQITLACSVMAGYT